MAGMIDWNNTSRFFYRYFGLSTPNPGNHKLKERSVIFVTKNYAGNVTGIRANSCSRVQRGGGACCGTDEGTGWRDSGDECRFGGAYG
jgi:hypothetical protein